MAIDPGSFDAYYYQHCCGRPYVRDDEWLRFFGAIADRIVRTINPRRVLDAGCAMGFLVEEFRARGVEAFGVDLSAFAIDQVHPSVRAFCREGSIGADLDGPYDLIVCMEVAEHMPPHEAEAAIANLCRHTSDILFSSSPHDYREPTHVNVHTPDYWSALFAQAGFIRDLDFDASFIVPWAARYRRSTDPLPRVVQSYERRFREHEQAAREARAYATEIQARAAHLEGELGAVRGERDALRDQTTGLTQALEAARAEGEAGRAEAERTVRACHDEAATLTSRLALAEDRVAAMQRSPFWRVRSRVMRVLGRR